MSFIRLHITAEGRTEENFIKNTLCPHLGRFNISADVRLTLTSKNNRSCREYRGGFRRSAAYETVKRDIQTWMREDRHANVRFSTMFDLYGLPNDFPGHEEAQGQTDPYGKVAILEKGLARGVEDHRFIPYIQLHEFETLIFANPHKLDLEYLDHRGPVRRLAQMVEDVGGNPELIDDGRSTAPSKRIIKEIPEYDKINVGPLIVEKIGLDVLRRGCSHFSEWLTKLESLSRS